MKKTILFVTIFLMATYAFGQDEGNVVIKERFERDKSIYLSLGPAFTLGKNLGDYSTGFNVELGYLKRVNRVFSIGPSLSYLSFAYDASKTQKNYYDQPDDVAIELSFSGGNVSLLSLGANIKLNFVPVSDNTKFSVYGVATPFVAMATKSEMTGNAILYQDGGNGIYTKKAGSVDFSKDNVPGFKKDTNVTGGIAIGLGFEVHPAQKISFFGQLGFSYTLPVNYIATSSFVTNSLQYEDANGKIYYDEATSLDQETFPIVKKGFSAANLKIGIAYNF